MKKGFTLLFVAFAISNAYSQNQTPGVGIGTTDPTATLDINGSLRFREGAEQYAVPSLPLILGTDEDGNVLPNKIGNGLESSAGNLKVVPKPGGGVIVNANGVAINPGNGIAVDTNGVTVNAGDGIVVNSNGVAVNPGNGISVDNNGVAIKNGNGISFNSSNAIQVQEKPNGGIDVSEDGVSVKTGEAIILNDNGKVSVNYSTGLLVNADNKLILDPSVLGNLTNPTVVEIGDGLAYEGGNNATNTPVIVKKSTGIEVSSNGVSVKAGNGITTDSGSVVVKAGNGITVSSTGVAVRAGNGITTASGSVAVRAGDAITVSDGSVNVKAGNGAVIYDDKVSIKTGIGTYINSSEEVDIKLDPNSSMKLEPSYGLKLQTHPDGGLRIQDDARGESRLRIALDSNSGLKIGSQVNTTVPYSPLSVNANTNKGLGVDASGVYVKLGNGLEFDTNGNIKATNNNTGTITNAESGLTLSNDRTTVSLGGDLKKPTTIETSAVNTLALTGLQVSNENYNNLVINASTGIIQYAKPQILATPVPAAFGLSTSITEFLKDISVGQTQQLTNIVRLVNNIPGLIQNGSILTIPPGVYQFTFTIAAGNKYPHNYNCSLSSYFVSFPGGSNIEDSKIYLNTPHKEGNAAANHGGMVSYTTIITQTVNWPIAIGKGGSGNCEDNPYVELSDSGTQVSIFRMGNVPTN